MMHMSSWLTISVVSLYSRAQCNVKIITALSIPPHLQCVLKFLGYDQTYYHTPWLS